MTVQLILLFLDADTEILLYALLDAAAKPAFGTLLLVFHAQIEGMYMAFLRILCANQTSLSDMETVMPDWLVEPSAGRIALTE